MSAATESEVVEIKIEDGETLICANCETIFTDTNSIVSHVCPPVVSPQVILIEPKGEEITIKSDAVLPLELKEEKLSTENMGSDEVILIEPNEETTDQNVGYVDIKLEEKSAVTNASFDAQDFEESQVLFELPQVELGDGMIYQFEDADGKVYRISNQEGRNTLYEVQNLDGTEVLIEVGIMGEFEANEELQEDATELALSAQRDATIDDIEETSNSIQNLDENSLMSFEESEVDDASDVEIVGELSVRKLAESKAKVLSKLSAEELSGICIPSLFGLDQDDSDENADDVDDEQEFDDGLISCNACKHRYTENEFPDHVCMRLVKKPIACKLCPRTFSTRRILARHLFTHTDEKPFPCGQCGKVFYFRSCLAVHMRVHTKERPYVCEVCGASFTQRNNLQKHRAVHPGEKPFPCDLCDEGFYHRSDLVKHRITHTGEKPYVCGICCKAFAQKLNMQKHLMIHSNVKRHACDECSMRFRTASELRKHMRVHTGERPFSCNKCHLTFAQSSNLRQHNQLLHPRLLREKNIVCDVCGDRFYGHGQLMKHLTVHGELPQYKCNLCNKEFYDESSLDVHRDEHANNDLHVCEICDVSFSNRTTLSNHLRAHWKSRRRRRRREARQVYRCKYCPRTFFRNGNLQKHLISHAQKIIIKYD